MEKILHLLQRHHLETSIGLHILVVLGMIVQAYYVPSLQHSATPEPLPLVIDLNELKITDETNLPELIPDVETKADVSQAQEQFFEPTPPTQPQPSQPTQPILAAQEAAVSFLNKMSEQVKEVQKNIEKKVENKPAEKVGSLDDLLSSVDGMKREQKNQQIAKTTGPAQQQQVKPEETLKKAAAYKQAKEGIERFQGDLSLSILDALRIKLRNCWNLDPGVKGIANMVVDIKAVLNPDGSVASVEILDQLRYARDPSFRAVADSARRAVLVCSPFDILPRDKYYKWKEAFFTFDPAVGQVM